MKLSDYQVKILNAVKNTSDNLIIQACAGSGKTTTLEFIAHELGRGRHLALAFNKSIANEFAQRLPRHVHCRTIHALGLELCRHTVGRVDVDVKKGKRIIDKLLDERQAEGGFISNELTGAFYRQIPRLASWALAVQAPLDEANLKGMLPAVPEIINENILPYVKPYVEESRRVIRTLSFDDMIDHPLTLDYFGSIEPYDTVLVDESQDLNMQQILFIQKVLASDGRLIAVGDRNQAIYGFRGADEAAMDRLGLMFDCRELPLSFCYRCGTDIIEQAQEIVGKKMIVAPAGAPAGEVVKRGMPELDTTLGELEDGDMVVCRANAPLVRPCLSLIRKGVKAIIRGNDFGREMVRSIKDIQKRHSLDSRDVERFIDIYEEDVAIQIERLLDKGFDSMAINLQDKRDTLLEFVCSSKDLADATMSIQEIFRDELIGIVFTTIHKSKGLESNRVVILAPELIPHPMALRHAQRNPAVLQQEQNLSYVARTRAKNILVYQEYDVKKLDKSVEEKPEICMN